MNHKLFTVHLNKGLPLIFTAAFLAGLILSARPSQAVSAANDLVSGQFSPSKRTITIESLIDGRSQLILRKNTVQWYHFDFAVPGRWGPINDPTIINGKVWFPQWPDIPDLYNYNCYCYSDIYKGLKPAAHRNTKVMELNVLEGRGPVFIAQYPSASNDYALVIEFNDNDYDAAFTYRIELVLEVGGKP